MRLFFAVIAVLLFFACPHLSAQEITLEHADSSRFRVFEDSMMTYVYGDVHIRRGDADIYADSVFYSSTGHYKFMGNIRFADTSRTITTQTLFYDENTDKFRAFGRSKLVDIGQDIELNGDSVYYDNNTKILTVMGNPHIAFNINDPRKLIDVDCDSLVFYSDENYGRAFGDVVITKSNLVATCGKALMMPDSNYLMLTEKPEAFQDRNTVSGDSMAIYLKNDLLDYIDVKGNAAAVYKQSSAGNDTLFTESKLQAKKITFIFEDEELVRIQSAGNSYSEYIPVAGDSLVSGRNIASGDSIKLYFDNRNLEEVEIIISCEGKYLSSPKIDSTGAVVEEDTINYKSDRLLYKIGWHVIDLYSNAEVSHQTVSLEADTISYDTDSKVVRAESWWKSLPDGDSLFHPVVLRDQADVIYGSRLAYNVDTRRGKIKQSDTEMDNAYYHGNVIRKQEEDVLYVNGGSYTTCNLNQPHFHFYSNKMKLISNDRVIARPVVLFIEKIPVFYLPYFVFSIKKERHSGFLSFQIGNFDRGRRFVNNLGYYWALSDYYDMTTSIDYNDEVGVTFNLGFRYALRYNFSGSVDGAYARETQHTLSGTNKRNRWKLNARHQQTLTQTSSLSGTASFVSDASYYTDISTNPAERLDRSLRSQLNFRKSWGRSSFQAVVQGTNNLDLHNITYDLPRLSFSLSSRALFPAEEATAEKRWYQNLMLSYSVNTNNYISQTGTDSTETRKHYALARHNMNLSMPTNIFKYLTISPNAVINENWFYIFDTDQSRDAELATKTGLRRADLSFGMSANTKLYGLFRPPISGLIGIRHVMNPSINFSYRPKSDRHADEASFVGLGSGGAESQNLGWSLSNLFQMKYKKGEQERKLDLFTLAFSANYNFKAEGYKWSDLSTTMRSSTIPYLTFSLTARHDLYNRSTQKLDVLHAHLKSISLSTFFSYSGQSGVLGGSSGPEPIDSVTGIKFPGQGQKHPWSITIGHRYAESRGTLFTSITNTLTMGSEFYLTDNWKVGFSQYYDIRKKEIVERRFSFYRDLHCWEAVFYWIPNGSLQGYYFRINIKALPDIKIEKSESGISSPLSDQFNF
jgi:lipopolysaccharide assembly outer membrane protein LptD (OstA)